MMGHQPTPYPEVNAMLRQLWARAQGVLGDQLVGLALYGSLAGGDFDPASSDIDFVAVTAADLPPVAIASLAELHADLAAAGGPWAAKLEGAYLPRRDLRRHDPAAPPRPYVNEGRFTMTRLGADWVIQRHVLREHGVTVAGPAVSTLIDPVTADALRSAVQAELRTWWAPMLDDPDPRLAGPAYRAYAALSMCRALYTLRHGEIASKPASGRWARTAVEPRWAPLIDQALTWPAGPGPERRDDVLGFIRYALAHARSLADDRPASEEE